MQSEVRSALENEVCRIPSKRREASHEMEELELLHLAPCGLQYSYFGSSTRLRQHNLIFKISFLTTAHLCQDQHFRFLVLSKELHLMIYEYLPTSTSVKIHNTH
jgi:hypothetical protein